ncbi:MAG: DUF5723 family protein, partial [Bacteroidota bacterium]
TGLPQNFNLMGYQKLIVLSISLCLCFSLFGQDLTTPLLSGSWQSTFSNPALIAKLPGKITVGLPGVYNDLFAENFTYNDLLVEENGRTFLDANRGIALLEEQNQIRDDIDFESVGIAIRGKRWSFGLQHRLRYQAGVEFPKTLAQVIWEGNAQFIGQTVDIAPQFQVFGYHELGLTAAFQLNEQLSIGGRIKYLSGISDASSVAGGRLMLTTDGEAYDLTLDQDYTINSSGSFAYNGLDGIETDFDFANVTFNNFIGTNSGIGFDLGAQLDLGNIRLQAAALDLAAQISWEDNVRNYRLEGEEAFTGLDVLQDLLDDTTSFAGLLDSLEMQFEPTETNTGYSTDIGTRFLLGGELDVNDQLTLGALLFYQDRPLVSEPSVVLSGRYRLMDNLIAGATYSYRAGSATNIGLNLTAGLGPVRLLLATDNIITAIQPKDSNRANVRIGLSLSFLEDQ